MLEIQNENKRIAKNTFFMYLRMLVTVCVSLYTSRVVLQTLGVVDYGLNNVIGGIIAMFGFINGAMTNTTSRFITFYLGKNDEKKLNGIFNMASFIHAMIAVLIVILGETIGLWFLHHKMTIPEGRMYAAEWLYQLSIANMVIMIMTVPYNAAIVAHEKMSAFAYISIMDSFLKLGIVFLLVVSPFDKLIFYGTLIFLVQMVDILIYIIYCKRHFVETKVGLFWDKTIFKEMYGVAGWSLLGNFSFLFYNEGINLILNMFCGPAVNAARGIAVQVDNVIRQFSNNIQTAINPQIIKSYASGEKERMFSLMFASSRYCFYLLFFLSLPLALEVRYVLSIWLGDFPSHTVSFLRITLGTVLLETLSSPMYIANLASGKVKIYQVWISVISYFFMPITYLMLKETLIPEMAFLCLLFTDIACAIARIFIVHKQIGMPVVDYCMNVLWKVGLVVVVASIVPMIVHLSMPSGFLRFLCTGGMCVISVSLVVYFVGVSSKERLFINKKIKQYI